MPNVLCLRLSWQNRGRLWGRRRFEVGFGFYPWMDFSNFRICVAFDIKVGTKRKERFLGDFTRRGATLITMLSSPLNETFMHSFHSLHSFLTRIFTNFSTELSIPWTLSKRLKMETGERLTDHRVAVWETLELGTPLSKVQIGLGADSLIKERLGAVEIRLALDFLPKNHFDVEKLSHERQRAWNYYSGRISYHRMVSTPVSPTTTYTATLTRLL